MAEQKIIFSNRFEKEKFEDYKTDLGTGNAITPDFTEDDDFLKFIQKNRRSVPSKERIADKDKFIKTVYELSNSFEIDADLIELWRTLPFESFLTFAIKPFLSYYDKQERIYRSLQRSNHLLDF